MLAHTAGAGVFGYMSDLKEECLGLLNDGHFKIVEPGPLHAPIQSFSLRRDDKLTLILETLADPGAKSTAVTPSPGTVQFSTERARLVNIGGVEGELVGVITSSVRTAVGDPMNPPLKETAQVHFATIAPRDPATAAYMIDWLENLPASPFIWPDVSKTITGQTSSRTIALDDGITITSSRQQTSISHNAAKLTVAGNTFYVCALGRDGAGAGLKPGCIVFDGMPDEMFRKKVRTALSLVLGVYLVDLGHTRYDRDWRIVSALARSAYSLGRRAFDMDPDQPAPLGLRFRNELNSSQLRRAVAAMVAAYDELDLANLSWAYWHACTATPHIAPAHFGAAIEALQRAYVRANPGAISETWAPRSTWRALRTVIAAAINAASIAMDAKSALVGKLANFNQVDQRPRLKAAMKAIGLELGSDEDAAWARRNKAAHGMPIPEGQELAAIRDTKLLRGLFNRLLLRITNAADEYIDYTSPEHPYRRLADAPPSGLQA
jgi:hypothetical protein